MKKQITVFLMLVMIISYISGFSLMHVMAKSSDQKTTEAYYTSIIIEPGDSLWSIASEYCGDNININDYISQLKKINQLKTETIHSGQFLTVVYYK